MYPKTKKKLALKALIGLLFFIPLSLEAQTITLKGRVVDEKHEPVAGATIWLEYTHINTVSDRDGAFVLSNIPKEALLQVKAKAIGYQSARLVVDNSNKLPLVVVLRPSPLKLDEVVVTGTGTRHLLKNSPVDVDVFTQKELKSINAYSFESAMMALSPNISFAPTVMGSNLQINGLNNSYILVLVDGKRLAGDMGGNTDLARINMNNIKRIEVQRGAASSLYGSEAMGGVINIITDQHKQPVFTRYAARYAGERQLRQNLTTEVNLGIVQYSANWQRMQTPGWQLSDLEINSRGDTVSTVKKAQNRFYSDVLEQKLMLIPDKNFSVYLQGTIFDRKISRPTSAYAFDMKFKDYSFGAGAKYMIEQRGVVTLDYYTDNYKYYKLYTKASGLFAAGEQERARHQQYSETHLKTVYRFHPNNRFTGGVQHQVEALDSQSDLGGTGMRQVYTTSLYFQDEIKIPSVKLQIVPGVRYVYHQTFKNRITPKLALMYSPQNFNFRASYSAGYKAPELKKLYSLTESTARSIITIPNTELKPETSHYGTVEAEYMQETWRVSVSAYYNQLRNLITRGLLTNKPAEYASYRTVQQYQNTSKARVKGLEATLDISPLPSLSTSLAYSFTDSYDYDTRTPLEKVSKHVATFYSSWSKNWSLAHSQFTLSGRWQSRRYNNDGEAKAFNIWNITTTHRLKPLGNIILESVLGVENIFDFTDRRPFGVNYGTLSPGRTLFVGLAVEFAK